MIDIGNHAGGARDMAHYWDAVLKALKLPLGIYRMRLLMSFTTRCGAISTNGSEARSGSIQINLGLARILIGVFLWSDHPRACSLAGVIGKSMTRVPLGFDIALKSLVFRSSRRPSALAVLEISRKDTGLAQIRYARESFDELITCRGNADTTDDQK